MMKKMLLLITALLLTSVFSASTPHVHASGAVEITPSTAFVGTPFREILIYVKAWDDGWATSVSLAAKNVPIGLSISFQPKSVSNPLPGPHTIESTMTVNGGTAAPGSYDITIEATWTSLNPFDPTWHRSTVLHLEVKAVPEGTITANPYLVVNQGVWTKRIFGWNAAGSTWDLPEADDLYVNWYADGQVRMRTSDTVVDWNYIACEFKQKVYTVSLNPNMTQLTLRASARNISGYHASSPSWEGIKFDAWAKSTKDNHRLFVEMYFYRSGINLNWDPDYKQVNPGNVDTDDYMVNIASSDAEISSHVKIKQESGNSLFTIDLTYFFQRGAKAFNRTLADYVLDTIGINCEAGNVGPYPTCWVTLSYLESMGSYLADVNCDGSINIMDIVLVSSCFGAQFGSANYRPAADINLDKIIDIFDLTIVSSKFGKIFPNS